VAKKIKFVGSLAVNKDKLPSFSVFNDTFSTTIFNGEIGLSTKISTNLNINTSNNIITTQKDVTLNDLKITDLDGLNNFIKITSKLKLNLDRENLSSYAVYGSLKEKFRVGINNIINKFPGGLYVDIDLSGVSYYNVLDYTYDDSTNISTFKIPITLINNPFLVNYQINDTLNTQNIDNFTQRYTDYVINYQNINYSINEFTGTSSSNTSYLYFSINDNPFSGGSTPQNFSDPFLIKPNDIEFNKFYNSLNELETYFLNKNTTPKYTFTFKIPEVDDNDSLKFNNYTFNFPLEGDGYNLDTESTVYVTFLETLFDIADLYDEYKSNLIIRKFIPQSVLDFDETPDFNTESIFKIYGKEIDEIKMFIDSLMNINATSYDKINNIPDILIKNLARTLGWKARNIINDKDLISSVFANNNSGDTDVEASLAEVDIELWRRLVINTAWFMKSKGTRKALETIFNFLGAPQCLISLDEYVYVVDKPINSRLVDPTILIDNDIIFLVGNDIDALASAPIPYDDDGYPIAPIPNQFNYFQMNGNEDNGKKYIDLYTKLGYNVVKTLDNKKSWVYYESANTHSSTGRGTNYTVNDSRLIINTKEVTIGIDVARAIECDVYEFNKENNYPVSSTGRTSPYPQRESNKFDANSLTFAEYVDKIYSTFINAQNRKVSDSAIGSYYPSLTQLYYDYLDNSFADMGVVSNKRKFKELLEYVDNLDNIFDDFIKQFIPATTIFGQSTTNIRNTIFTPQKYVYKQGIDDGSEFQSNVNQLASQENNPFEHTEHLVDIQTELFDDYDATISIATISQTVESSDNGNINTPEFTKVYTPKFIAPVWDSKICEITKPTFQITGVTKIELSSLTNNSLVDKSTQSGKTITFNFTSGTDVLSASTTEFYYSIHKYDNSIGVKGFVDAPIYTFSGSYSSFTTSSTISDYIMTSSFTCDSEYIIKPYYIFNSCADTGSTITANSPYTYYESMVLTDYNTQYPNSPRFLNLTGRTFTGESFSTLIPKTSYTPSFRNYNTLDDYYFVTVCNPDKPTLTLSLTAAAQESEGLVVENIPVNRSVFSSFTLQFEPIGDIIVSVNGITIQKTSEYANDIFTPNLPANIRRRSFILYQRLTNLHDDILTVAYYKNPNNVQRLIKEDFLFTGSTSIELNATLNKYVITLSNTIFNNTESVVYLDGVMLQEGSEYYSNSPNYPNKIILDILPNDPPSTISVLYFTYPTLTGQIINATNPFTIGWKLPRQIDSNVTGDFIHQFYDLVDTGFTGTTLYTALTNYDYLNVDFTQVFDWNQTTLTALTTYNYRLASTKKFKTINNIDLNSVIYSDGVQIKLPA
jgi:hypothetical protein